MSYNWSKIPGPVGPGFLMFVAPFEGINLGGSSGSDSVGDKHTFQRDKHFPEPRIRVDDDEVAILIALFN